MAGVSELTAVEIFQALGVALALGLLVGVEREWTRNRVAGINWTPRPCGGSSLTGGELNFVFKGVLVFALGTPRLDHLVAATLGVSLLGAGLIIWLWPW